MLHSVAKNVAHFFLDAMTTVTGPLLKSSHYALFKISDKQLRHWNSPSEIMISEARYLNVN